MIRLFLHPSRFPRPRGQDLVEFALIIPILMLFIYGIIDLARVFQSLIVINNAAREGARYGMLYGMDLKIQTSQPDCLAFSDKNSNSIIDIIEKTKSEALSAGVNLSAATVTVTCPGTGAVTPCDCRSADRLKVSVAYPFQMLFQRLFSRNFQSAFTLNRSAEMQLP
jgi:hypothetical protein